MSELKKMTDALFNFFIGMQGRPKRSKLDRNRKLEKKDEYIYQNCPQESYSWQKPHPDVIENILEHVTVGDRIQLSMVSKHWNSIVTQRDIRGAPHELPWLLLPYPRKWEYLSFLSLSDGKQVKLKKLPKSVEGGWVYGSTNKGSLIILKEQGLKSAMFLVNPISGSLHKLPPFKTIPCFREFIKSKEWRRYGASDFCPRIAVDSIDSNNWTMAALVLSDNKTLGVCSPGDKTWSVFQTRQRDGEVFATRTLKSRDNGLEVKLKLIFDRHEILNGNIDEYHSNFVIQYNSTYCASLSESIDNEVLVIHQIKDNALNNPDAPPNVPFLKTTSFSTYRIDQCKDKLISLQCLGDQLLFLGEGRTFSLAAKDFQELRKNNCIYFATQYLTILDSGPKTLTSQEFGIFYLDRGRNGGRVERPSLAPTPLSNVMYPRYQPTWFIPYF